MVNPDTINMILLLDSSVRHSGFRNFWSSNTCTYTQFHSTHPLGCLRFGSASIPYYRLEWDSEMCSLSGGWYIFLSSKFHNIELLLWTVGLVGLFMPLSNTALHGVCEFMSTCMHGKNKHKTNWEVFAGIWSLLLEIWRFPPSSIPLIFLCYLFSFCLCISFTFI